MNSYYYCCNGQWFYHYQGTTPPTGDDPSDDWPVTAEEAAEGALGEVPEPTEDDMRRMEAEMVGAEWEGDDGDE